MLEHVATDSWRKKEVGRKDVGTDSLRGKKRWDEEKLEHVGKEEK